MPRAIVKPAKRNGCCGSPVGPAGEDLTVFASVFKALGEETRLSILGFLLAKPEAVCACDIEGYVKELSQPTISHHLRLLREAGLVTAERRGTWVYYGIDKSVRQRLLDFAGRFGG